MAVCIFCQIVEGDAPAFVVAEDDKTMAFLDIAGTEGHTLVVPRRHAADIWSLTDEGLRDALVDPGSHAATCRTRDRTTATYFAVL